VQHEHLHEQRKLEVEYRAKKTELPETRKKSTENLKNLRFLYQSVR